MHVPEQIARDNVVLDAFVIERQHVLVKANDASQCKLTGQGGEYVNVIINPARKELSNARKVALRSLR
jgi:hypothetical protein